MHPLAPFAQVVCPTENCTGLLTKKFNRTRPAAFNIVQRHYAEIEKRIGKLKPSTIDPKTLLVLKKHRSGEAIEKFDIKCGVCKKRHEFKINTLTGELINPSQAAVTSTIHQSTQAVSEATPHGNRGEIGPRFQEGNQPPSVEISPNSPLVFVPDNKFISQYPHGAL